MIILDEYGGFTLDGNYYDEEDFKNLSRLQSQLFSEENIIASFRECANIWQNHSWSLHASWMDFPNDYLYILKYIKESEGFVSFDEWSF